MSESALATSNLFKSSAKTFQPTSYRGFSVLGAAPRNCVAFRPKECSIFHGLLLPIYPMPFDVRGCSFVLQESYKGYERIGKDIKINRAKWLVWWVLMKASAVVIAAIAIVASLAFLLFFTASWEMLGWVGLWAYVGVMIAIFGAWVLLRTKLGI